VSPLTRLSNVRRAVAAAAAVLSIVLLFPIRYLASPRWTVWVVDDADRPVPGIFVRLTYQNYSAENRGHELTTVTDGTGHVVFPPEYRRASVLQKAFHTLLSATAGAHASSGRHAYVFAFGEGQEGVASSDGYVADWQGSPDTMDSKIVVTRMQTTPD